MAIIERQDPAFSEERSTFLAHLAGRIIPHVAVMCWLMYHMSDAISTVHNNIWVFCAAYAVFTTGHSLLVRKRWRMWVIAASTLVAGVVMSIALRMLAPHGEAGMYSANVVGLFLTILLWFSAVNNTLFLRLRLYYWVEVLLINALWIAVVLTRLEEPITRIFLLTFPLLLYSLYVLVFRYLADKRMAGSDRRKVLLRFLFVLAALLLALFIGHLSGIGIPRTGSATSYSMLSKKNDRYTVEDRATMDDELKVPLDSKELVLVANIDPIAGHHIGYYLKFHSLYNYDPVKSEFNTRSDEMEDPRFHVERVPLKGTLDEPTHLVIGLDGATMIPPYDFRADGRSTIYNVKLDMDQTFGHNLTYRFVSYMNQDSIAVADRTYPLLGIYRLFSRISVLNVYPLGVGGQQYDQLLLGAIDRYEALRRTPQSFTQPYLNITGLERDIVDLFREKLRGCSTVSEKLAAVVRFFRQGGPDGRSLFVYDLKPGKPSQPGESRLHHFLLSSHRGYCTYYATAAAMFLRVAGIPSRVAIGFAPDQGSEKNPGWYYIYTYQGHAWVEVYLGEALGWVDLDMTPGSSGNTQGMPPPDPTPPPPPMPLEPQYHLVAVVRDASEPCRVVKRQFRWKDEERDSVVCQFPSDSPILLEYDTAYRAKTPEETMSQRQAVDATLRGLQPGDSVLIVGRVAMNPAARYCDLDRFTFVRISRIERDAHNTKEDAGPRQAGRPWWMAPWLYFVGGVVVLFLLLAAPWMRLAWLERRAMRVKHEGRRLEYTREWLFLRLHLSGWPTVMETDSEYAARLADEGLDIRPFIAPWLRYRYLHDVETMMQPMCRRMIADARRFVRTRRGVVKWLASHINLWQFIRHVNRRQTL